MHTSLEYSELFKLLDGTRVPNSALAALSCTQALCELPRNGKWQHQARPDAGPGLRCAYVTSDIHRKTGERVYNSKLN